MARHQPDIRGADMSCDRNKGKIVPLEKLQSVQEQASVWLARLDGDKPSEQELQAFRQWINEDNAHVAAFEKVTAAWQELNILTRLPPVLRQKQEQPQPAQTGTEKPGPQLSAPAHKMRYIAAAAALVITLFAGFQQFYSPVQEVIHWTAVGEQKTLTLPDNSVVQLNTNSRIKVDFSGKIRAVYLYQGEAHFDVAPNPLRPFEVYAGAGRVRAIGTAFSVTLVDNSNDINVIVTQGVVEVAPEIYSQRVPPPFTANPTAQNSPPAPVGSQLVEAGKSVVFDQEKVKLVQSIETGEVERRLAWQHGQLIFSGESLEEVVAQISRYTDTKILVKSEDARKLRIGGQFRVGDTKAIFNALDRGFGIKADYVTNSLVYLTYNQEKIK